MALTREKKEKIIEEIKKLLKDQKAMVFFNFTGLKTKEMNEIREALKQAEGKVKVVKKTLAEIAFKELDPKIKKNIFKNQLAIGFGMKDEIAPMKILYNFFKNNEKVEILGGYLDKEFLTKEKVLLLAQIPSKENLRSQLLYIFNYPILSFANVLNGNIKGLVNVLAKAKKN